MEEKDSRRKRYILVGILVVIAAALGIERCMQDRPEEEPSAQHQSATTPTSSLQKTAKQAAAGSIFSQSAGTHTVHTNMAEKRRSHAHQKRVQLIRKTLKPEKGSTPVSSSSSMPSSPAYGMNHEDSRNAETNRQPSQKLEREHAQSTEPSTSNTATTASHTGPRYTFSHRHLFRLGLRAGAGYSKITGLGSIVESYDVRPTFTMEDRGGIVPRLGVFATWQYRRLGAELGVDYMRLSSKITEHKLPQNVTETTKFHYDFLAPQLMFRFYVFPKIYMGAGISAAIPFGSRHIDFSNDRNGQVYRQQAERTQDHLRESLKARVLFMPSVKLGFADPRSGLEAGIEYGFGLNDLLRTRSNDYSYQERKNNVQYVSFTIGYSLPLNKKE